MVSGRERTARQKTIGELLLPGDGTLPKALRVGRGIYRKTIRLDLANQSLRDQFQIAVKFQMILLGVAAAAAFSNLFSPEQKLSPPNNPALRRRRPADNMGYRRAAQEPNADARPACWPSSIRLSGSGAKAP